jgi:PAS domain S-box-containing protein
VAPGGVRFETAQDAILIVDPRTRRVFEANPFLTDLLGYAHAELVGKELWEIGLFRDAEASKAAFRELQERGYIRCEDPPLRTKDGRQIEVEFVGNLYPVDSRQVVECNIRDISDRKRAEVSLREAPDRLEKRVRERTFELAAANDTRSAAIAARDGAEAARRDVVRRLATAQEDERRRIARDLHDEAPLFRKVLVVVSVPATSEPPRGEADDALGVDVPGFPPGRSRPARCRRSGCRS